MEKKNYFRQTERKKSSLFLNIRTTQFDHSSPVQPHPEKTNLEKSKEITFFQKNLKILKTKFLLKKGYSLSFLILGGRDSNRALQSSLFQISGGGYPEPDGGWRRTEEILASIKVLYYYY